MKQQARAYTPGLTVTAHTRHRARRLLPIAGDVLVKTGDQVQARQVVAQALMPGDITPLNMSKLLSMPPAEVPGCMLKQQGDRVAVGEVLARTKGIFGMMRTEYKSSAAGTIETISATTGQLILRGEPTPVQAKAYLSGTVIEIISNEGCVIEADIAYVQGIFGIGGEAFGKIRMACKKPDQELTPELLQLSMKDAVVIGGARVTHEAISRAKAIGAAAIVTGGIDDEDLEKFLGYSVGVAITGSEQVGLTLILTEGFGPIAMAERTFNLLASHEDRDASVNGATQIRAGVMRPEIVIPRNGAEGIAAPPEPSGSGYLEIGSPVRVIRDPYFGRLGSVSALPSEPAILGSGSKARVVEVKFASGDSAIIPRANVEMIEG
jgi:hypothetical protein